MHLRDYIQATYEVLQKDPSDTAIFKNLFVVLQKRGLEKKYPRVLRGLRERVERSEKSSTPMVILAREKDFETYKHAIDTALKTLDTTDSYGTSIDPTIVGGFIVKGKSTRIDHSYKSTLLDTYHRLID